MTYREAADDSSPMDPSQAFVALGQVVLGEETLDSVLNRVADVAKRAIPGAAEVSVTLLHGEHPNTAAFTGPLAIDLDERQYQHGYGPCLHAARTSETVVIDDMAAESRWPRFTPLALRLGVRSSLSVGLPVGQQVIGALNIYGISPAAFDADAAELARTFASYAAVALANAALYASTAELAAQMRAAMESRAAIEQAKGVIMGQLCCDADTAFAVLIERSQHANRKLRDVANDVIAAAISTERPAR